MALISTIQYQSSSPASAPFQSLTLGAPVLAGSQLLVTVYALGTFAPTNVDSVVPGIFLDGNKVLPAYVKYGNGNTTNPGSVWSALLPADDVVGIEQVRVENGGPNAWAFIVIEVGGAASALIDLPDGSLIQGIRVDPSTSTYNTGTAPQTVSWTALDVGIAYAFMLVSTGSVTWVEPAGWSLMGGFTYTAEAQSVKRPIAGPGAETAEAWTGGTGAWVTVLWAFYDLNLRVPTAEVTAHGGTLSESSAGSSPKPSEMIPFQPAVNPLPPDPDPIIVPLAPWVPGTGPYRRS